MSLPDIVVFDRQGRYIPYSDDGEWICKSNLSPFISLLSDTATYQTDSSRSAGDMLDGLYSLDGEPAHFLLNEETDFVVVVLWASFIGGRLAKNNIPEWELQARENSNANIDIVKISLDPQAWWPESDTLKFGSSGKMEFSR